MTDPAEWLVDYWQRCQYDDDLMEAANAELSTINQGTEE